MYRDRSMRMISILQICKIYSMLKACVILPTLMGPLPWQTRASCITLTFINCLLDIALLSTHDVLISSCDKSRLP